MDNGCGEWVQSWLEKAGHDLETARRLIEREPIITDTAVYHCQQAAEKALKAVTAIPAKKNS